MPENKAFGGFVHRFSSGGRVPGTGSGDKVRALLEPGEFVIEKNVANRHYSELERLNEGGIIYANDGRTITNGATPSTIRFPKISEEEKPVQQIIWELPEITWFDEGPPWDRVSREEMDTWDWTEYPNSSDPE